MQFIVNFQLKMNLEHHFIMQKHAKMLTLKIW